MLWGVIDDGHAIHYSAVSRDTPVFSADEVEVGRVAQVVDNYREHILDGIVIETADGRRWVDGPEVSRTAERGVTLTVAADQITNLPAPEPGTQTFRPNVRGGRLSRLFRGGWRRD
jgi:hypothetical protein